MMPSMVSNALNLLLISALSDIRNKLIRFMIISFSVYMLFSSTLQILKAGWSDDYLFKSSGVPPFLSSITLTS